MFFPPSTYKRILHIVDSQQKGGLWQEAVRNWKFQFISPWESESFKKLFYWTQKWIFSFEPSDETTTPDDTLLLWESSQSRYRADLWEILRWKHSTEVCLIHLPQKTWDIKCLFLAAIFLDIVFNSNI